MQKKEILRLNKKIEMELSNFKKKIKMLKGTVYPVNRKYKNAKGEEIIKKGYQLTYKGERNKSKTIYIKKSQVEKAKKLISNYREAKKIFERIIETNIELFKLEP